MNLPDAGSAPRHSAPPSPPPGPWRFCVAPMMDWTDRHYRYFARLLSRHTRLYTEMIVAAALVHGNAERLLRHDRREAPVALQLGGSNPRELAVAAALGAAAGYEEINLNVGCPSDRVQAGRFGACLIAEPALVAECVAAMREAVSVPVTVKTRLGVDQWDSYEHLASLVAGIRDAGCEVLILHARKAILGLNTRDNRLIPPLDYARARRIKQDFPMLTVVLNGGLTSLEQCQVEVQGLDGVMVGRAAYERPMLLAEVDRKLFGDPAPPLATAAALRRYLPYLEQAAEEGQLRHALKHLHGLFSGEPGAREWRRSLSEEGPGVTAPGAFIEQALARLAGAASTVRAS